MLVRIQATCHLKSHHRRPMIDSERRRKSTSMQIRSPLYCLISKPNLVRDSCAVLSLGDCVLASSEAVDGMWEALHKLE